MFVNTLVEGKIPVKVLIDTASKYNTISKHLFDKLESDHGLADIVGDTELIDFQIHKNPSFDLVLGQNWLWMREAKISFGHSHKTRAHHAKIVIDGISIPLFDEDFNKASFTKNNLSKSTESKSGSLLCNIPPIYLLFRRLNNDVSKNKSKKNNIKYSTDASSNLDTLNSDSSNSSTSSSEIKVTHAHKTRAVKKCPIRKRKVKGKVNY
ncbi:14136_t:CDS:2 [Cetraspora pellucida]|uniref:14136_t:CDS:1 n=1 Tax=Cetraspora pellucida TaxID=1433469 RepID=A0A9N9HZT6_9GLOM|nr:14136_t:CDS:2 [Cetraspora pellucida]